MKAVDANKLFHILKDLKPAQTARALADLFTLGCFLHMNGHKEAGLEACCSALRAIGNDRRKGYFSKLISSLPGNEARFSRQLQANEPIRNLLPFVDVDDLD